MGTQVSLIVFVLASGFITAGLLNAVHQALLQNNENGNESSLVLYFDSPGSTAWSVILCVFAGPYLVLSQGIHFWRRDLLPLAALCFCAVISLIWSFCAGVVVMEVLIGLGIAG